MTDEQAKFLHALVRWQGVAAPANIGPQTKQSENSARQTCKRRGWVTFGGGYWRITDKGRDALESARGINERLLVEKKLRDLTAEINTLTMENVRLREAAAIRKIDKLSDQIEDPELQRIAKAHDLDDWEWGGRKEKHALLLMEGVAIAIRQIYQEGRHVTVLVHQSGVIEIRGGAYFQYQINPSDEIEMEEVEKGWNGWDGDPVVKQYECENRLTICWDERAEMFGE